MPQLPLYFENKADFSAENFIVSGSNQAAFDWVQAWPDWPSHASVIYGPGACGKTHLASIWQGRAEAIFLAPDNLADILPEGRNYIVENIETVTDETGLFHLFNTIKEHGNYLLLTSSLPVNALAISLPDLSSRLKSVPSVEVTAPDDVLLKTVLLKHFSDRQLKVSKEVVDYLVARIERSFSAIRDTVAMIDRCSLEEKRNITIPLIRKVLP